MSLVHPSTTNVYVPSPDATGQVISFTRDPKSFKLPQYIQYVNTDKIVGLYTKLGRVNPVRSQGYQQWRWGRGSTRPEGNWNGMPFEYLEYRTERHDFPFVIPYEVDRQASWPVLASHAQMLLSQAMTNRTDVVVSLLQTTDTWPTNHTDTVNSLNGGAGYWDNASNEEDSPNYLAIKKSLDAATIQILKSTNSMVSEEDLVLIMSPFCAQKISQTDEIRDMIKQSPDAMDQVRGNKPNQNKLYGLPEYLYGYKLVVENAVICRDEETASDADSGTQEFIWSDDKPCIVSRKGGLEGQNGAPTFSTVQAYFFEELTVESLDDPRNRRTEGHVVDDFDVVVPAGVAGYLFQDALSS